MPKNQLLLERLVEIESDATIDNLKPGSVVYAKNSPMRGFGGKEGDLFFFYYTSGFSKNIIELRTPRDYISTCGTMVSFSSGGFDRFVELTPDDSGYKTRKDDLVALGLMKD